MEDCHQECYTESIQQYGALFLSTICTSAVQYAVQYGIIVSITAQHGIFTILSIVEYEVLFERIVSNHPQRVASHDPTEAETWAWHMPYS